MYVPIYTENKGIDFIHQNSILRDSSIIHHLPDRIQKDKILYTITQVPS